MRISDWSSDVCSSDLPNPHPQGGGKYNPALFLALARPDFIARRRDASGEHWLAAGGRGFTLDPASPLARAHWLVIGDAQGQAKEIGRASCRGRVCQYV